MIAMLSHFICSDFVQVQHVLYEAHTLSHLSTPSFTPQKKAKTSNISMRPRLYTGLNSLNMVKQAVVIIRLLQG